MKDSRVEILEKIENYLQENEWLETSHIYKLKEDMSFIEDLGFDSLDQMEALMYVEEEYGLNIPDDEAEKLYTIRDLIDYIQENCND